MNVAEATERAEDPGALRPQVTPDTVVRRRTILAGIDPRSDGDRVVDHAVRRARSEGADLVIAYVLPLLDPGILFDIKEPPASDEPGQRPEGPIDGVRTRTLHLTAWGNAATTICDAARAERAHLIVTSGRKRGRRAFLRRLAKQAPCPVETVQERAINVRSQGTGAG